MPGSVSGGHRECLVTGVAIVCGLWVSKHGHHQGIWQKYKSQAPSKPTDCIKVSQADVCQVLRIWIHGKMWYPGVDRLPRQADEGHSELLVKA